MNGSTNSHHSLETYLHLVCGTITPPSRAHFTLQNVLSDQCDQIGRFIALWATFQSLWQQLGILPKSPTFFCNLLKGPKSFIFLVKSFLDNFYRQMAMFTGHAARDQSYKEKFPRKFALRWFAAL